MRFDKYFKLRTRVNSTKALAQSKRVQNSSTKIQHTIKFGSIFAPDSLRGVNLLFRSSSAYNSLLTNKPSRKILVKQSYIFMVWVNYLCSQNSEYSSTGKNPAFFVYPKRNYKTTIMKAPMAHKTYSQEQFMIRFYNFSITFHSDCSVRNNEALNSISRSGYFAHFLKKAVPFIGTNMLFISKYSLVFRAKDSLFFSLTRFNTNKLDIESSI